MTVAISRHIKGLKGGTMLASHGIANKSDRERISRQAALMIAAVHIHKQEAGLPLAAPPIDPSEVTLLNEARAALDTARKENGHDLWGVLSHLNDHESTRRFLKLQ